MAAGGITPQTAARWELLADVPAALITKEWQRADAKGDDLTEKRIHDLARERRMRVRDARDPRRAAQMRRERAVDRAHAGLMRRVGAFLAEDSAEAQKLAVILADRTYVSAHDVKRLRDAFLALGARIAEACAALEQRMDVAMDVPLESSVLAGEDRQRMKAQLARGARPSARGSRRE